MKELGVSERSDAYKWQSQRRKPSTQGCLLGPWPPCLCNHGSQCPAHGGRQYFLSGRKGRRHPPPTRGKRKVIFQPSVCSLSERSPSDDMEFASLPRVLQLSTPGLTAVLLGPRQTLRFRDEHSLTTRTVSGSAPLPRCPARGRSQPRRCGPPRSLGAQRPFCRDLPGTRGVHVPLAPSPEETRAALPHLSSRLLFSLGVCRVLFEA